MSFNVTADAYARFMGQYSEPLAIQFVEVADLRPGQRALDVGCGPGALTEQLVSRLGSDSVTAVDPSPPFVDAARERFPGVDVRAAGAEQLPFDDGDFDASLAQLVVHFMTDPVAGLREMARVTQPGGLIAACVWDHASDRGPLSTFWKAVHSVDPAAPGEADLAGARGGHLAELFELAGLVDVEHSELTVSVPFASFEAWWEPYTLGVGPAGAYVAQLDAGRRGVLEEACARLLPDSPFEVHASAWCARGRAAG